jgi:hypothetical protein
MLRIAEFCRAWAASSNCGWDEGKQEGGHGTRKRRDEYDEFDEYNDRL